MINLVGLAALFASALFVAGADALIKKISGQGDFIGVILNPWFILILFLYFIQILFAIYIFLNKGDLAIYGNIFIIFYSILMVILGVFAFKEHLSYLQYLGIFLGLTGAILLNSGV